MKSRAVFRYFIPAVVLIFSWVVVLLIREFPLLDFDPISIESKLYLLIYFSAFLFGTLVAPFLFGEMKIASKPIYLLKNVDKKANWLITCSLIGLFLLIYKFYIQSGGSISFSLADITEMRFSRGRDESHVKGQLKSGVLGMILSGFFVITYVFKEYFFYELPHKKKRAINMVFIFGIFVSFLSGGRWASATALLVAILASRLSKYSHSPKANHVRPNKKNFISKIFIIILLGSILYIFSLMFLDRVEGGSADPSSLLITLENNFDGISVPNGYKDFLNENPAFISLYYVSTLFQYYIAHGVYQFDVLFSAPYPLQAPYALAYQLYLHITLLNKFGATFISSSDILAEIVNPGVYFTLAGAFYLDFGYWGGCLAAFIVALMGSYFWVRYIRKKLFFDMYISILFLVIIILSPIVSIVATGVFPSLLTLAFILKPFIPKKLHD